MRYHRSNAQEHSLWVLVAQSFASLTSGKVSGNEYLSRDQSHLTSNYYTNQPWCNSQTSGNQLRLDRCSAICCSLGIGCGGNTGNDHRLIFEQWSMTAVCWRNSFESLTMCAKRPVSVSARLCSRWNTRYLIAVGAPSSKAALHRFLERSRVIISYACELKASWLTSQLPDLAAVRLVDVIPGLPWIVP